MENTGYFIIADISGYSRFISTNDLEHAHGVLSEITTLIISHLAAPLQFVELEGDAVFVFAPDSAVEDAERLIEILEACYAAFTLRLEQMIVNTSCDCTACQAISELDLKCVAHHGIYLPQTTPNGIKLFGSDVVLTHRLLKNEVIEKTGIESYAFLSDAFLAKSQFGNSGLGLSKHSEDYPEFGSISGRVLNLATALERYRQEARYRVTADQCDVAATIKISAPRNVVWSYFIDPNRRMQWQDGMTNTSNEAAPDGRMGIGARSHCDHGGVHMAHRVVDYQPVEYVTFHTKPSGSFGASLFESTFSCSLDPISSSACEVGMFARLSQRNPAVRALAMLVRPLVRRKLEAELSSLKNLLEAKSELNAPCQLPGSR